MTKEEWDFIGSMNMCDEISNEAYKKIACHCEEQEPCEDAVSRQAVLNEKYLIELEDGQSFYCINPEDVEALPPVTPQQRWIPVSERLPEENGGYLVTVMGAYVTTALWVGSAENWRKITAWMPLPGPYKAESEE